MTVPVEALLVLGVLCFYLHDASCLLYRNEVIFSQLGKSWRGTTGSSLLVRGRYLFVPNPLTPYVVMFRSRWRLDGCQRQAEPSACVRHFLESMRALRVGCSAAGILLLLVLPVLLLIDASPLALLVLLALVYATVLAMVAWIYRHRNVMELSGRQIVALALDALACPPHAINLARNVALKRGIAGDALSIADAVLRKDPRGRFRLQVEDRIAVAADFAEQGSIEMTGLETSRRRLQALSP